MSIRYLFGKKKAYTDAATKTKEKTTGSKARSISDFAFDGDVAVKTENLDLFYGEMQALKHIDMTVPTRKVTALIGPSGCGKSTLLRTFNRMNDLVEGCKVSGSVKIGGTDVYQTNVNLTALRKNVGMVFQKPNPFPMSIYDNVAFGPRNFGIKNKAELDFIVETSLKQAAMWDELKDRLGKSALGISGGQQQRLCIARWTPFPREK